MIENFLSTFDSCIDIRLFYEIRVSEAFLIEESKKLFYKSFSYFEPFLLFNPKSAILTEPDSNFYSFCYNVWPKFKYYSRFYTAWLNLGYRFFLISRFDIFVNVKCNAFISESEIRWLFPKAIKCYTKDFCIMNSRANMVLL